MDSQMHDDETQVFSGQTKLPWHKPAIQQLTVSLDTANTIGSGTDLETHGVEITT